MRYRRCTGWPGLVRPASRRERPSAGNRLLARHDHEKCSGRGGHVPASLAGVATMVVMHATGKQGREQLVVLDAVIERVDHPIECLTAAGPLVQRRLFAHSAQPIGADRRPPRRCRHRGSALTMWVSDRLPALVTFARLGARSPKQNTRRAATCTSRTRWWVRERAISSSPSAWPTTSTCSGRRTAARPGWVAFSTGSATSPV